MFIDSEGGYRRQVVVAAAAIHKGAIGTVIQLINCAEKRYLN
jgi:hypothetical protein